MKNAQEKRLKKLEALIAKVTNGEVELESLVYVFDPSDPDWEKKMPKADAIIAITDNGRDPMPKNGIAFAKRKRKG